MTDLAVTAANMQAELYATGQPQAETIRHHSLESDCRIILRHDRARKQQQVVAVIEDERNAPPALCDDLRAVFWIPNDTLTMFDLWGEFGITKWTWDIEPPEPCQAALFDGAESAAYC